MTMYGSGRRRPDWLLLGSVGFLIVALVVGAVFAVQGFFTSAGTPPPAATGGASPTAAASASAAVPSPDVTVPAVASTLRAKHSLLCLQGDPDSQQGGPTKQATCSGAQSQRWVPQPIQEGYLLVNAATGRCLDVNGGSPDDGATVLEWGCHRGPNQQWRVTRVPDTDAFTVVSVNSGKCVSVKDAEAAPDAAVVQSPCTNSPNQHWTFAP